jgi:PAS domain S-box-containing protein
MLASTPPEGLIAATAAALERIGEFFQVDHCALYQVKVDGALRLVHFTGNASLRAAFTGESVSRCFPWMVGRAAGRGETLRIATLEDLPACAAQDREHYGRRNINSALVMPLAASRPADHVLAIFSMRRERRWVGHEALQLRAMGELLMHAMTRISLHDVQSNALTGAHHIAGLATWQWDTATDCMKCSEDVARIFGAEPHTLTELMDIVHPTDRVDLRRDMETACTQPGQRHRTEYVVCRPEGDRIIEQWHEALLPAGGASCRLNATVQDVTELRKTEREVKDLRAHHWHFDRVSHTGVLVASLAHELSQPLSAVLSNAQAGLRFIAHENAEPGEIKNIFADIVAANKRATDVLGALRSMMRRQHTERSTFDIADGVRKVLGLLHSELTTRQVDIETALAPDCLVLADSTQIEQVVLNLVMNAIDAMSNQPLGTRTLSVRVTRIDNEVRVAVSDRGTGVSKEHIGRIFEAFWTTKSKGMGMGLSVCRAIIESHSGRLWVENNKDRGATFFLKLAAALGSEDVPRESEHTLS